MNATPSPVAARRLVTLTTDFGTRDPYVGAMKGVLRSICDPLTIDDLSHEIAPQDILEAALFLEQSIPFYPPGSVHLVVVDPGVGTARRPLAVYTGGNYFVCPDNGLLSLCVEQGGAYVAHELTAPAYRLAGLSDTFHGRDLFAPAAAWLASGVSLEQLGPRVEDMAMITLPKAVRVGESIHGEIIHVDRFGNCITNIGRGLLEEARGYRVVAGRIELAGIHAVYGAAPVNTALALFGGSGRLEIALRDGNASAGLELGRATPVTLNPCS